MAALIAAHTGVDLGHLVGIWASPDCLSEVQKSLVVTESRRCESAPQILARLWATRDLFGKSDSCLASAGCRRSLLPPARLVLCIKR